MNRRSVYFKVTSLFRRKNALVALKIIPSYSEHISESSERSAWRVTHPTCARCVAETEQHIEQQYLKRTAYVELCVTAKWRWWIPMLFCLGVSIRKTAKAFSTLWITPCMPMTKALTTNNFAWLQFGQKTADEGETLSLHG